MESSLLLSKLWLYFCGYNVILAQLHGSTAHPKMLELGYAEDYVLQNCFRVPDDQNNVAYHSLPI